MRRMLLGLVAVSTVFASVVLAKPPGESPAPKSGVIPDRTAVRSEGRRGPSVAGAACHAWDSVIDILCAFVRHPPHEPAEPKDKADEEDDAARITEIRPDAQTILKLIAGEDANYRHHLPDDYHLDLTYAHLVSADLIRADLTGANLRGAVLTHADLTEAILRGVDITFAHFADADLAGADFRGAIFARTYSRGGGLAATDHLRDAMANVIFADADLTGTDITDAKNLTQVQVDSARCDPDDPPMLPPGLTPPKRRPKPKP